MAKINLLEMKVGDERHLMLRDLPITVVRRSQDFMVYLDGDRSQWEVSTDPNAAVGKALLTLVREVKPERYEWLIRWHLPGEANRRVSRMLGIDARTKPSTVWDMIHLANPGAICDEITNLTLTAAGGDAQ